MANRVSKPKFDPVEARRQLAEFLDADVDVPTHHPLYPLYQQLLAWEDAQEEAKRDYAGKLGADKGRSISLLSLFPGSPAKLGSKIAGLPKPDNCL